MESATAPGKRRIAKPLGVYVITAFDGIFIGLVPPILLLVLGNNTSIRISEFDYYLTAALRIIVVGRAVFTISRNAVARR
jgi:hypothetical protein